MANNATLGNWQSVSRAGLLSDKRETERATHWVKRLAVRLGAGIHQEIGTLSGGNQQKIVMARWLDAGTRLLVLVEPTRGVDVGARADLYAVIEELRKQGLGIVLVSSDMEELLGLSDRMLVFSRGRIAGEFARSDATQETLLTAAASEEAEAVI